MSLEKTTSVSEIALRFNTDGTLAWACRVDVTNITEAGVTLSIQKNAAVPISAEDLAAFIGENHATLIAQLAELTSRIAALEG